MFYGDYRLLGGDDAQEKFGAEAQYFKWTQKGTEKEYSKLPFRIKAGKKTLMHSVNYIKEYNWMELSFMRNYSETSCNLETALCAYSSYLPPNVLLHPLYQIILCLSIKKASLTTCFFCVGS